MSAHSLAGRAAVAIAIAGATGAEAARVTPLAGSLTVAPYVDFGTAAVSNLQIDSDDWTLLPTDLTAAAVASLSQNQTTITAQSAAVAHWISEDAGQVKFTDVGWTAVTAPGAPPQFGTHSICGSGCGVSGWRYTFVANEKGGFHLDYDITGDANDWFGANGWSLVAEGAQFYPGIDGEAPPGAQHLSGSWGFTVLPGKTYHVELSPNGWGRTRLSNQYVRMTGVFDWRFTKQTVPEPATWALMILGLGLAGCTLRRRRAADA